MDLVGQMKKVVTFKQNTPSTQGAGGKDSYSDLLTTRGYLKKSSGSRNPAYSDILGDNSWTLIVRKQAALTSALSMSLKIEIDNKLFTIQSWEDVNEDNALYKFSLTQQDA